MTVNRTLRQRECRRKGCGRWFETPHGGAWPAAFCSPACWKMSKPQPAPKPRASLRAVAQTERKPVAVASREQAAKRAAGASIVSGETRGLDAAHLCPRDLGGCDHEDCTVPLTREEHRAFDAGERDLLPDLIAQGCIPELQHALEHYRGDLIALLERLTGCRVTLEPRTVSHARAVH